MKDKAEYEQYVQEFTQFNNHFRLDERAGCYRLDGVPVNLVLVIDRIDGEKFANIVNALASTDTQKARCFVESYRGIKTKVPPLLPFVLRMQFK
jgi:hypothetical protein